MPRSLIFGNGEMLATFDKNLEMRDFYFPYVGMEDHTDYGSKHNVGIWVEGKGMKWFSDPSWEISPRYKKETMVGDSVLINKELGLEVRSEDQVHPVENILLRRFFIKSSDGETKNVRVFFNHNLYIYGDKQKDTAFYEPYTNTVIHYRQTRYFLIGGGTNKPTECATGTKGGKYASALRRMEDLRSCGISSYSVGKSEFQGKEGTWKDAEDGELQRNPIEQGSVDSTVAVYCTVAPKKETEVNMWLCAGKKLGTVLNLHETVLKETPERLHRNCSNYWESWVNKTNIDFGSLDEELINLYKRSLLLIRMHANNNGAIIAAADSDIMAFNRDTYTYMWPRDGALVSLALDHAGYTEVTRRFFHFCANVQTADGYLFHKYNPDQSLGSSWHPWYKDGEPQLPIQEDETALVLYALWQHFQKIQDFEFLQEMWETSAKNAAKFLSGFREESTGLPLMSYDPWEEHRGIFSYTTACTIAGLNAGAEIAKALGHNKHADNFERSADEMRQAMLDHLFDEKENRFVKYIKREHGETTERDLTIDASICILWKLGVLGVDDPRMVSTMDQLRETLTVHTEVGGIARYTDDYYHSVVKPSREVPGNPWILTTLWLAQWDILNAKKKGDLESARKALEWTKKYASGTGILAEQLNPLTGEPLSVAPLTWSHATYVETVLMFLEKEKELTK